MRTEWKRKSLTAELLMTEVTHPVAPTTARRTQKHNLNKSHAPGCCARVYWRQRARVPGESTLTSLTDPTTSGAAGGPACEGAKYIREPALPPTESCGFEAQISVLVSVFRVSGVNATLSARAEMAASGVTSARGNRAGRISTCRHSRVQPRRKTPPSFRCRSGLPT